MVNLAWDIQAATLLSEAGFRTVYLALAYQPNQKRFHFQTSAAIMG